MYPTHSKCAYDSVMTTRIKVSSKSECLKVHLESFGRVCMCSMQQCRDEGSLSVIPGSYHCPWRTLFIHLLSYYLDESWLVKRKATVCLCLCHSDILEDELLLSPGCLEMDQM